MASITLHMRNIKRLPNGEYSVQVELINTHPDNQTAPSSNSILESITLSARTKNIERLMDPRFVEDGAHAWFESRLGKWDKVNIQKYFEYILRVKH